MKTPKLEPWAYAGLLALAGAAGLAISWTAPGREIDSSVYDFFFRLHTPPAWQLDTITLGIDERTLNDFGGVQGIRRALARGIEIIASAHPQAVAVDVILANSSPDDALLEAAFRKVPIVLCSDLLPGGTWDNPIPRFRTLAAGIGQVHSGRDDRFDAINREIPLEKVAGHERRWALALESFRVTRHAVITESPDALEVAGITIPSHRADGRLMRVRYVPPARGGIPSYSIAQLVEHPALAIHFANKVVFAGVTAQTAVRDRLLTPYGAYMPGVEINADAFETISHTLFLTDISDSVVVLWCAFLVLCAGAIFAFAGGWQANLLATALLVVCQAIPYWTFTQGAVLPYVPGTLCAAIAIVTGAGWRHLFTRRELVRAEASELRYQRAMQFVVHEMRTPLTAIQGSSELITRYALPDEKRKQIAGIINSESKRLAHMIETFLNVERLSGKQMELKRERFPASELIDQCLVRVQPLAERKNIEIVAESVPVADLTGDRELMEYAVYNLLTNAVKYSPAGTHVAVSGSRSRSEIRVWVQDQGIGLEKHEVRRIFERFYRTNKAEQTGEAGSGIGLSIVEQIIIEHGGSIMVDSTPGKGSRFTLVMPVTE